MASWNTHGRDPLLDSNLHQMLQKRGRELLGLVFLGLAVVFGLIFGSYSPEDPSWMASTDMPVQNSLGRVGAGLASPLMIIIGLASWGLVLFFAGWGLRLIIGRGQDGMLSRGVFVPIALAVTAIWCATLVPMASWDTIYGMGGIFGDTLLGAIVNALPMTASAGVTFMSVVMLVAALAVWAAVLGVDRFEAVQFFRFVTAGLILFYAGIRFLLRGGISGSVKSVQKAGGAVARKVEQGRSAARAQPAGPDRVPPMQHAYAPAAAPVAPGPTAFEDEGPAHTSARRAPPVIRASGYAPPDAASETAASHPLLDTHAPYPEEEAALFEPPVHDKPAFAAAPEPATEEQGTGLLAKLKSLSSRSAEPPMPELRAELVEPPISSAALQATPPGDARIRDRIADVIRHRKSAKPVLRARRAQFPISEPPLRAPQPAPAPQPPVSPPPVAQPSVAQPPVTQPLTAPAQYHASLTAAPVAAIPMPDWMVAVQPAAPAPMQPPEMTQPPVQRPAPAQVPPPAPAQQFLPQGDDMDDLQADTADIPQMLPPQREAHVLRRRVVPTAPRKMQPSRQAQAEAQPSLQFEPHPAPVFELPPLSVLQNPADVQRFALSDEALEENARMLETVLEDYGVRGEIVSVRPGPVVTQYELEPAPGLKASRVIGLADDIARSMSALSARVSTVPGRSIIGIELPNAHREKVVLREILSARDYGDSTMRLPLALGKAIDGEPIVANLAKMPHLLIAGTTGSGKSVAINTMILSLLYRLKPEECRMIMIDPKMLELSVYDGIPHLLSPVVTDPKKAVVALKWVVGEMEDRYRKMSKMGVRNIEGYNGRVREALERGEMFKRTIQTGFDDETGDPVFETDEFAPELLPFIVVIVDEMADLMMVAGKEIEACIQRLAQMARASGIHLIMATQRPSVDVITGTIKANFPTRISFQVTSKIDSRTILGEQGAEQLLGMGDMLYMAGGGRVSRIHGPFVSDEEVEEVVNHLKSFGPPDYKSGVVEGPESDKEADIDAVLGLGGNTTGEDALYDQAVQVVIQDRKCSTSYIQRKLGIGYNKAARLVEQMEDEGLVTAANHVGKREILVPEQG